jgi:hypothetical protein
MAALLSRFADRAMSDQAIERRVTTFDADMNRPLATIAEFNRALARGDKTASSTDEVTRLAPAELLAIGRDGALPGASFERCLDDLLARVQPAAPGDEGVLFMLRNDLPTLLLHDALIRERAAALYHDDVGIVHYCQGVVTRRQWVRDHIGQICIVLPWNARRIMNNADLLRGYPSQAESAGGQVLSRVDPALAWKACIKECRGLMQGDGKESVRMFDGNPELAARDPRIPDGLRGAAERLAGRERLARVASLPDCWVWVSRSLLKLDAPADFTIEEAIAALCRVLPYYCNEKRERRGERVKTPDEYLLDALHRDQIRIIEVSRARYNPRYRGRLIVNPKAARKLLVHTALCLALSTVAEDSNLRTLFVE